MTNPTYLEKMSSYIISKFLPFAFIVFLLLSAIACSAPTSAPAMESMAVEPSGGEMVVTEAEFVEADLSNQTASVPSYQDGMPLGRKIIARATMSIVVEDTQNVVDALQTQLNAIGGYVANANLYRNSYGDDERLQGTMTARIPAAELETVMADLEALAISVRDKTINREDVTDQYSDVQARIRNLEATENELREMLAEVRAKPNATPEDILTVYRHLTEIRGQIEEAQGRKNMFDNLVSLSTLELTLTPNWNTLPIIEEGWQPGNTLRDATRELVSSLQGLAAAGIWLVVYLLPILLILAIPVLFVIWLVRRAIQWLRGRRSRRIVKESTVESAEA